MYARDWIAAGCPEIGGNIYADFDMEVNHLTNPLGYREEEETYGRLSEEQFGIFHPYMGASGFCHSDCDIWNLRFCKT